MNAAPVPTEEARTGCGGFTDDTENLSTTCRQSNSLFSESLPPRKISEILSEAEFTSLAHHLHNGNGPHDFGMGIAHADGTRGYYAAKNARFEQALESAWNCIVTETDRPFAVTVHATNNVHMSCWAGFDIDAHSPGQKPRAQWVVRKLIGVIRRREETSHQAQELAVLVEDSGRGFHVWLISSEQRSVGTWNTFVRGLLREAGIDSKQDGVETFPSGRQNGLGHAFRLPGTANINAWHPADGSYSCSMVLAESGLMQLIERLPRAIHLESGLENDNKRGSPFIITPEGPGSGWTPAQPKDLHDHVDAKRVLGQYAITSPASRHLQLCSLVGDGSFHFSRKQLRSLAERQYEQASPSPETPLQDHLIEFEEAYEGLFPQLVIRMSVKEQKMLRCFKNLRDREAFVIAQNFARHAAATRKWGADSKFPLSGLDLATRLGENTPAAYRTRKRLITAGCIRKVEECKPCREAEKYVWLLSTKEALP